MEEILQEAAASEAVEEQVKVFKEVTATPILVNKIERDITPCTRCGSKKHGANDRKCPAFGKRCFRCNGSNHFQSKCRSKISGSDRNKGDWRDKSRYQPYQQRGNDLGQIRQQQTNKENSEAINKIGTDNSEYIFCMGDTNRITCLIGGVSLEMVVDSGSRFNIICKNTWENLKRQNVNVCNMNQQEDKTFKAYGDHSLNVVGSFEADIQIDIFHFT